MAEAARDDILKIITEMVSAVTNVHLYPATHPQVAPLVDRLFDSISLQLEGAPELTLVVVDDDIVVHGKPLSNAGPVGKTFVRMLKKKDIDRITLITGLSRLQLFEFLCDLAVGEAQPVSARTCIKVGKVSFDGELGEEVEDFLSFREKILSELKKLYYGIRTDKSLEVDDVKNIVAEFIENFTRSMNPLSLLAALKCEDEYTYVHATNVALLTMCLAEYIGFSGEVLEAIGVAALLHDVGKMVIPDEILNKAGALDSDERAVMETHTLMGVQYLARQNNIPSLALLAALEHHIKFDGSGYPRIAENWRPNIVSQMVSVADVFDALRSRRPYREPVSQDKIIVILRNEGGRALNPELVEHFIAMIER